jgi:hypothetical protein
MRAISRATVFGLLALAGTGGCIPTKHHQGANLGQLDKVKIVKGETTEKQLTDWFGPPSSTMSKGDGSRTLSWMEVKGEGSTNVGLALLSIPGARTVQAKTTTRSLTVTVKDGIVTDYMVSDTAQQQSF